jgi:hypothetical protein
MFSPARMRTKLASSPGLVAGPWPMFRSADRSSGMMLVGASRYSSRLNCFAGTWLVCPEAIGFAAEVYS